MNIKKLIAATEAAIAAENDPRKLRDLQAKLAMQMSVRADMGDDDDDGDDKKDKDDGDDGDDGDESKAEKAKKSAEEAKRKAEAAKHRAKAAEHKSKAAEYEEAAKKCEESEEEKASGEEEAAMAAIARDASTTGLTPGALAALTEKAAAYDKLAPRLASLESVQTKATMNALIQEAVARRCITRHQAVQLGGKSLSFVTDYLAMHKSPLVNIDEDALLTPDQTPAADLPAAVRNVVEQAVAAKGLTGDEADKFREKSYAAHRKALTSGAGVH